jgi:predicted ATP-dependent endonuclease of OLD family
MQIKSITLHNFRSIEEAKFNLGAFSLLIGANNSGKSNIIDAFRVFYEKDLKYEEARDFPKFTTSNKDSWMEIEFLLSDEEYSNLKEEYKVGENELRVRKFFKTSEKGKDGKTKQGIYAYTGESISEEHFYGAKSVQQGKLGDLIYIPAVSRLEDHTKLSGPSALRDLLNDILKKLVKSSSSFRTLTDGFDVFAKEFKKEETEDLRSISGLEKEINDELTEWEVEFELNINPVNESEILKSLVSFKILDKALGENLDAKQFGQGFQRHLIYTLIRMAAKYQTTIASTERKEFLPNMTLLLFEEPEAFLHPTQQSLLCRSLSTLAKSDGTQVIISSHSPIFVSHNTDDISSIVRLCRDSAMTKIGQIDAIALEEIFEDNKKINELLENTKYHAGPEDLQTDMEAVKYFLWLDSERCGLFFSKQVLLVEGPTERVLLDYLFNTGSITLPKGGVFVLDCLGKFNIHRFMNLLGPLNIQHSVLFDRDGGRAPHDIIKRLIDDSKNECTYKIEAFSEDIETFLGIPKASKPHRKPPHVMLWLKQGKVTEEKMRALTTLISGMIQY